MRICIVGAGPAGLAAAIAAGGTGAEVVLVEKNDRCGAKLLATGGGRCNVTNLRPAVEWPGLFGRHGRFIVPALSLLPREKLLSWFAEMGQPLASPDGFHLFPESNSARAVRDALLAAALKNGVEIRPNDPAEKIRTRGEAPAVAGIALASGNLACDKIILATGGKSWPATGSTGDGCRMAEEAGHAVHPAYPGLVGLRAGNLDPGLAGLVLPAASVVHKQKGSRAVKGGGELLITHHGVSGPAVLDISATVCQSLAASDGGETALRVNWIGGMNRQMWVEKLDAWRKTRGASPVATLLREHVPARLARWLCGYAGFDPAVTAASLSAAHRDALTEALSAFPLRVVDSEGWNKAMITRGGVDLRQVAPETLQSRLVAGLYFAGEMLDIDGPCGGYNLHWAFASGLLAGRHAAQP